jgi:hypothetical protein
MKKPIKKEGKKQIEKLYLAEMKAGKTYCLPIEFLDSKTAEIIAKGIKCQIVLLPLACFNLNINA